MKSLNLLFLSFTLLSLIQFTAADAAADRVAYIPGWPSPIPFDVYAGYLDIPNAARSLFYIMTMSQHDPANAPVVLWLNGGPACSSLMGFASEVGPFVFEDGQSQVNGTLNPYAWNKRANLVFLESPAGVGFSQANVSATSYSDNETCIEQLAGLIVFFARFPNLAKNEFYIAGESYAGIYIPNLAAAIDAHNAKVGRSDPTFINLKGIMVGNGVANRSSLTGASIEFYYKHDFIPEKYYQMVMKYCYGTPGDQLACNFINSIVNSMLDGVNPYSVYRECFPNPSQPLQRNYLYRYTPWYPLKTGKKLGTTIIPCVLSTGGYAFFNNPAVRQALHVNDTRYWDSCNDNIFRKYVKQGPGTVGQYQYLKGKGYKILVYGGDTDAVVPISDAIKWVYGLGWDTITPYGPWYCDGQLAGWTAQFDGVNLTTVRGAGHMVPQWSRPQAFLLFDSFINGTALPTDPLAS